MPPESSCGYWCARASGCWMPTRSSRATARVLGLAGIGQAMDAQRLRHLLADAVQRVQRDHRVLRDPADLAAAHAVVFAWAEADQLLPLVADRTAGDLCLRRQHRHDGAGRWSSCRAGFADQRHDFASAQIEAHRADGIERPVARRVADRKVADGEQRGPVANDRSCRPQKVSLCWRSNDRAM